MCVGGEQIGPNRWETISCGAKTCVAVEHGSAICAVSTTPDPLCEESAAGFGFGNTVCDGSKLIRCAYGYRVAELGTCASPEACARQLTAIEPGCLPPSRGEIAPKS
jgi:hypothetical protein